VVAEGVETQEHVNILQTLHCAYAQGYLYTAPLKAEELTVFLKDKALFISS
jgi:EAL domain-containing protein (putative c-di-GMP-specific phosphodiesterase class I)